MALLALTLQHLAYILAYGLQKVILEKILSRDLLSISIMGWVKSNKMIGKRYMSICYAFET